MKKILVIEDNPEVREVLEEVLELSGYGVTTASDGTEGVSAALLDPPDLILCDVMMPKLDGYGVLSILSKKTATAGIPFVFLTAKAEREDMRRGMSLGADDYVTKPFYKDELLRVIETRMRKRENQTTGAPPSQPEKGVLVDPEAGRKLLYELCKDREVRSFSAQQTIVEQGRNVRYIYLVQEGLVKLSRLNSYGKSYVLNVLGTNDFFGHTAALNEEVFPFGAEAISAAQVCLLPKDDFIQAVNSDRHLSAFLLRELSRNITEKQLKLLHLAYDTVRQRVVEALLEIRKVHPDPEAPIDILRSDLAEMAGTAKETVVRVLTDLKQEGLIEVEDALIHIRQPNALAAIPG
jgi:DNA-binding response OmpR family regulator/DNA-binding MarR family transcriptional regulator